VLFSEYKKWDLQMKRVETFFLYALAIVLSLGFTGCGNGQSGTSQTPSSSTNSSSGRDVTGASAQATSKKSRPVQDGPNQ
jgi:hypothetical protein